MYLVTSAALKGMLLGTICSGRHIYISKEGNCLYRHFGRGKNIPETHMTFTATGLLTSEQSS